MSRVRRPLVWGLLALAGVLILMTYLGPGSEGQETAPKPAIGRYQIAAFGNISTDSRGIGGLYGYYVLDTTTGKVVAEKITRTKYEELPPITTQY